MMLTKTSTLFGSFAVLSFAAGVTLCPGQADDFNDGDDTGWTRVAPLASFGVPAAFSFPDGNSYRLECGPNNVNPALEQPRVGSLRDVTYTDFYVSVDIFSDDVIDQNVGILARVSDVGLGTLDGYGITYNRMEGMLVFSVILDEVPDPDNTTTVEVTPTPADGEGVRMIFQGDGADLRVDLFELDNLKTPIATIEQTDATYASGFCGIFNSSDSDDAATDSTFDNYLALEKAPGDLEILDGWIEGNKFKIEFVSTPGFIYILDEAEEDGVFVEKDDSVIGALSDSTVVERDYVPGATRLYRLAE